MARTVGFWKKVGDTIQPVFSSGVNLLIRGTDKYINFNETTGESGYGIRDNGGTLQYKNSAGAWTNFSSGGGGGGGHTIEDEGTPLTQRTNLNFVGAGVTVTDDAGNDATIVTILGGGAVDSVNGQTGVVVLDADDIDDTSTTNKFATAAEKTKLGHISVTQAVDLDALESASHAAVTVSDSAEIDFTLTGQQISASIVAGSIDESKLDVSVNASLDLADSASQPGHTHASTAITDFTEAAQDAVGGMAANSTFINLTYSDATPSLTPSLSATGTPSASTYLRGDNTWATVTGGSSIYFNTVYVDQSGGTSDTYGVLAGTINGSNALFTVSQSVYATGTLKVYLNGQLMTQGTGEDWVETTPASGTFTFAVAPATGSLITVEYQVQTVTASNFDELAQDAVGGILTDSAEIDFTYNDGTPSITASLVAGSVDETKLDASVNASLDLADNSVQLTGNQTVGGVKTFTSPIVYDGGAGQDYEIKSNGNNGLHIDGKLTGTLAEVDLSSNDKDGTDNVNFKAFGFGDAGAANSERLTVGYNASGTDYRIHTVASGTGTVRQLRLYAGANTSQVVLNTDGTVSFGGNVSASNLSGTNTGDQSTIVGITGTKAQFDAAVTDGNLLYVGDVTQYTDELAQDAVGAMVDSTLVYNDATPSLIRAALTGAITASAGSNTTSLGSFTKAQLDGAVSDGDVLYTDAIGVTVQGYSAVLAATTASFLTADETKLDGIEALADVTDATNVAAAGAFMKSVDDTDDITVGTTNKFATAAEKTKLGHITVTQAVDLDAIETASHAAVTVTDSSEINFTLTGQDITATLVAGSIDETKLDTSVNTSLDLADTASQPGHTHTAANITDFDTEVSNNTDVAANTAARHAAVTVTDSAEINFTLTGQDITASLVASSVDESKLDASVNASLDLADTSVQPNDPVTDLNATAHRLFYSDGSGNITELAFGADGTVLTSTGTTTAPAFETPTGGGGGVTRGQVVAQAQGIIYV